VSEEIVSRVKDILKDLGIVTRRKRQFKIPRKELKELPVREAYIEIVGCI